MGKYLRGGDDSGTTIPDWASFTPTGSWTTNTTYTGFYRIVGDTMEVQVSVACSGAPNVSTAFRLNTPTGYVVDTAKIANLAAARNPLGQATLYNGSNALLPGKVFYRDSSTLSVGYFNATSFVDSTTNGNVPFTWGSGATIWLVASFPVTAA
jgi:hypothetical protein